MRATLQTLASAFVAVLLVACPAPPRGRSDVQDTEKGRDSVEDAAEVTSDDVETDGLVGSDAEVPTDASFDGNAPPDSDVTVSVLGCPGGCDDGKPCTRDLCGDVGCLHEPIPGQCDDGDGCTRLDHCADGVCVGVPLDCDDAAPCTQDECKSGVCLHLERAGTCDDDNACTTNDACRGGKCVGTLTRCDDDNPCTDDYCDPVLGCTTRPNRAFCDDTDPCTSPDRCAEGVCIGVPTDDCCAANSACDDGNPCTLDRCVDGRCEALPLACDDGDLCSRDACVEGLCLSTPWGPFPEPSLILDDFENGLGAWTLASTNPLVAWTSVTGESGSSLYCGDPTTLTYDHGSTHAIATLTVAVPPQATHLAWSWRADLDDPSCIYDVFTLALDGVELGRICASGQAVERVDITSFSGRVAVLELVFDTRDALRNQGGGIWLDDLRLEGGPTPVCP